MTNHSTNNNDRPLRELIGELAQRQANTQMQLDDFISTANQVLARSAVLDDVVLELRDSSERHQRNFEEHQRNVERKFDQQERSLEQHQRNFEDHQRASNAAIQRLEAILLQLIPRNGRAGNE